MHGNQDDIARAVEILIAATVLDQDASLVSADVRHVSRIPDLDQIGYRD